jgi:tetratricopeptide (TPR) repeat protein
MSATRLGRKWRIGWRRWLMAGSFKTPAGILTSLGRSGAATLLAAAAFTGMLLAGSGCNTWGSGNQTPAQFRPAASETSRLLSNAHYYKLMGRTEAALKEMEEAHRADPNNLKIADALAQNYQELGQFQRAQEIYQEVLAHQGSNRAVQNNLCFSFYLQGNLTKAESCFKEALERDPGNLAARNNLGLVWCRQGKLAEAQRLWEEAEGVAGGQARMNQALAFLGMAAPTNYAKLPEAKPQPQTAAQPKPTAPVTVTPSAKPELAKAPAPLKASAPAVAPKVDQKVAAKPVTPKPAPQAQAAAPLKPTPPVAVVPSVKPELAAALTPVKTPTPVPPPAVRPQVEQKVAAKPAPPPQAAAPIILAATAKALTAKSSTTGKGSSPAPVTNPSRPELKDANRPTPPSPPLTALERVTTGIEVRNGTWTKDLAHQSRSLLSQEGFNVTEIGNHIDFGAESTVIYYGPGAERVAQGLNWEIFPKAKIAASSKLKAGVAIKVLLGRDLLEQP